MKPLIWVLQYIIIVLATLPLAVLPYPFAIKLGESLGSLLCLVWRSRRLIALENLKGAIARGAISVSEEPDSIIRENFRNLGRSFVEVVKIYYGLGEKIIDSVEIRGIENFRKAAGKGKGIVPIIGHCGNWELMAIALSMKLTRINVVARPLNNPYLNTLIERTREKYGNHIIYKKGALKKILPALKKNEVIGILMDQSVVRSEGIVIDFLGQKAYTMKIPALIARKSGAAVLPAFIRRTDSGHVIEIGEEIELDDSPDIDQAILNDTFRFTGYIEEYIRQNPAEWLWIHRRWKHIKQ